MCFGWAFWSRGRHHDFLTAGRAKAVGLRLKSVSESMLGSALNLILITFS